MTDFTKPDWRKLDNPGAQQFVPVHTRAETMGDDTRVPHQCHSPSGGNDNSAGSFADTYFPSAMMREWAKQSELYRQIKAPTSMQGTRHRAIRVSDIYHPFDHHLHGRCTFKFGAGILGVRKQRHVSSLQTVPVPQI